MGPTWGPSGADSTQVGPMLAPSTLLSGTGNVHGGKPIWLFLTNQSKINLHNQHDTSYNIHMTYSVSHAMLWCRYRIEMSIHLLPLNIVTHLFTFDVYCGLEVNFLADALNNRWDAYITKLYARREIDSLIVMSSVDAHILDKFILYTVQNDLHIGWD